MKVTSKTARDTSNGKVTSKKKTARDTVAGFAVPKVEMVPFTDLNFAAYNPRVMSAAQLAALKASLVKHGMVLNLVVQKKGMVLIGGHQRVRAMRELCADRGWPEPPAVPAVVLDVADKVARQLNVSLNRIDGEFDAFKLGELYAEAFSEMTSDDVLASGFSSAELEQLIGMTISLETQADDLEREAANLAGFARSVTLSVEMNTVERRDELRRLLKGLTDVERRKPGEIVFDAIQAWIATRPRSSNVKS